MTLDELEGFYLCNRLFLILGNEIHKAVVISFSSDHLLLIFTVTVDFSYYVESELNQKDIYLVRYMVPIPSIS